jgi:DNA-directed RNA polymerase subunit RPC12/RpoP
LLGVVFVLIFAPVKPVARVWFSHRSYRLSAVYTLYGFTRRIPFLMSSYPTTRVCFHHVLGESFPDRRSSGTMWTMPDAIWTCRCGAQFAVTGDIEGRRVKCTKCGHATVYHSEVPLVETPKQPTLVTPRAASPRPPVVHESPKPDRIPELLPTTFGSDILNSLTFFIDPQNLGAWMVVWLFNLMMLALAAFGLAVVSWRRVHLAIFAGFVFAILAGGWLLSYYMRIVQDAADGDELLPQTAGDGLFESAVQPLYTFVITWAFLLVPAFLLAAVGARAGVPIPKVLYQITGLLAAFMWPMAVLCVSVGGVSALLRADLLVGTILRTPAPYLFVCAFLFFAGAAIHFATKAVVVAKTGATPLLSHHPIATALVISLLISYISIVAMRVIGLYYRHFKHRFAWSWG